MPQNYAIDELTKDLQFYTLDASDPVLFSDLRVEVASSNELRLVPMGIGKGYRLTIDTAPDILLSPLGISGAGRAELPIDVVAKVAQSLLPASSKSFAFGLKTGTDTVRTLLPANVSAINPFQIMSELQKVVASEFSCDVTDLSYDLHHMDENKVVFSIRSPRFEPRVRGMNFGAGLTVSLDITPRAKHELSLYTINHWCTNGLISVGNTRKLAVKTAPADLTVWFVEQAQQLLPFYADEFMYYENAEKVRVPEDIADLAAQAFDTFSIPTLAQTKIIDILVNTQAETMFDVLQAFTNVASHDTDVFAKGAVLRTMSGASHIAATPYFCQHCHHPTFAPEHLAHTVSAN